MFRVIVLPTVVVVAFAVPVYDSVVEQHHVMSFCLVREFRFLQISI